MRRCESTRSPALGGRRGIGRPDIQFQAVLVPSVVVVPGGLIWTGHAATVAFNVAGAQAAAGCGGFQRRSPIGGAANGMPRNAQDAPRSVPWTSPLLVVTRQDTACELISGDEVMTAPDPNAIERATAPKRRVMTASSNGGRNDWGLPGLRNGRERASPECALMPAFLLARWLPVMTETLDCHFPHERLEMP